MKLFKSLLLVFTVAMPVSALAGTVPAALYKSPSCQCCGEYAKHLESHGYDVEITATTDLPSVKEALGVPAQLASCHTTVVGDYVIEGHVPAESVGRLLREEPNLAGIAVPGMPAGSPGMNGKKTTPLVVYSFDDSGASQVYETH